MKIAVLVLAVICVLGYLVLHLIWQGQVQLLITEAEQIAYGATS